MNICSVSMPTELNETSEKEEIKMTCLFISSFSQPKAFIMLASSYAIARHIRTYGRVIYGPFLRFYVLCSRETPRGKAITVAV